MRTPHPARLLLRLAAVATYSALALAGCRERPADSTPPATAASPAPAPTHRSTGSLPAPRWTRGGSEQDTLFADPTSAVADAERVYVLDRGTGRVLALRADDGRVAWSTRPPAPPTGAIPPSAPAGPDAATRPADPLALTAAAIAAAAGGGVAVADVARATITLFDRDGRPTRVTPLGAVGEVRSLCALRDSGYLVRTSGPAGGLLRLDAHGTARPLPLPWPDLADEPSLTTQLWLASPADGAPCAAALIMGRGFALYDGAHFDAPHPYVEPLPLPHVVSTVIRRDSGTTVTRQTLSSDRIAAQGVASGGGYLAVAFDGASPDRSRLVDLYDARSGGYLASALFPHRVQALATNGRDLFLLHSLHGRPALSAVPLVLADSTQIASARTIPPPRTH